jgi:hypothetical protein
MKSVISEDSSDLKGDDVDERRRASSTMGGTFYEPRPQSSDNKKNNLQIITKNVNNFITNNINNIIISPNFKTFQEFLEESKQNNNVTNPSQLYNNNPINPMQVISF